MHLSCNPQIRWHSVSSLHINTVVKKELSARLQLALNCTKCSLTFARAVALLLFQ